MTEIQNVNKKGKIFAVCGVLFLSAATAFWMLSDETLDSHECFVSVTAREMLQSGDWILPTCNGKLRINKTPLSYWFVGIAAKVTGKVNEFSARLPSAVFAVLSAAAILYFINRMLNFRTAVISTAVWATSLAYIRSSHNARPDMALTFFVTLCFLSFYAAVNAESRRRQVIYALVFWISFALGNLAKGPAPIPYIIIPLACYIVIFRQWKVLPKLLPVIGPIIFLAVVLPWPLAIAQRVNWDLLVWKREFVDRLFGDYVPGHYPIYFYGLMMFKFVTPWWFFLPMALTAPFYKVWGTKQPAMKFLWLWFVADIVFLTIDGGKRQHYILPLMPAMAVLIGILFEDIAFTRAAYTKNFAKNILKWHIVIAIAGMLVTVIYLPIAKPQLLVPLTLLAIITIAASLFVILLFAKGKPPFACAAIFAGIVVWFMTANFYFSSFFDVNRPSKDFAERVARIVPQSDNLVAYRGISSRFVQYFGKVVPTVGDSNALCEYYDRGDWIIAISPFLEELDRTGCTFRKIYRSKKFSDEGKEDSRGVLFHKSVPVYDSNDV